MASIEIGRGLSMEIDIAGLPQAALDHAIAIGLKNILQDSHAGAGKVALETNRPVLEVAKEMADKKLAALISGDVRVKRAGGGTRATDPVAKHAKAIARTKITAWEKANPTQVKAMHEAGEGVYEAKMAALMTALIARDDVQAEAKRRAEEEASLAGSDIGDILGGI